MARAAPLRTRAIQLQVIAYGESDQICRLLTEAQGRVNAFARNSRASSRRFRGGLGAFRLSDVTLRPRREGAMPLLQESEALESWLGIGEDPARLGAACWLVDLILHTQEDGEGGGVPFGRVERFLRWLSSAQGEGRIEEGLHRMELLLLGEAGWLPDLSVSARSGRRASELTNPCWLPETGLIDASERFPGEDPFPLELDGLHYAHELLAGRFPGPEHRRGRHLLRAALRRMWLHALGRELRSADFLSQTLQD